MGKIRILSERIANKIAAGEVIDRPASVVKELIENALDASATNIDITIEHGGKSLIRVADNGVGMDAQDAKLAFRSHATSKIESVADLETIRWFGFRGEALASIGAVSRTRLITREPGAQSGTEVVMEGGAFLGVQEHPCREGTIVEARDLFFNTPARRKFLKADSTELGHIEEVIQRLSLSAPQVQWTFRVGKELVLELSANEPMVSRAARLFREENASALIALEAQEDGIRLQGIIAKPTLSRANRTGQNFFVNRRWVRAFPFSWALQGAYHGLLMEDRFPMAILFLDLDPSRVDVNVHPTKQEVKISNESEVSQFITRAVRERLMKEGDLAPTLKMGIPSADAYARSYSLKSPSAVGQWKPVLDQIFSPENQPAATATELASPIAIRDRFRVSKVLGQIHGTFLLAETEDGYLVMDQHAAHERVQFEALLAGLKSGQPQRQMLFLEETLELAPRQQELFEKVQPFLGKIGFELESFGERTFIVRAYPAVLGQANPAQRIRDFLEELEEGKVRTALSDHAETLAALVACKRQSVKAGDGLTPIEIQTLLTALSRCENPFNCPHGRPVFFTQTISQLERQFKRT